MRSVALPANRKKRKPVGEVNPTRVVSRKRREKIREIMNKKKAADSGTEDNEKYKLVQLGDRVRIAGKYTGTVKFIGRLETEVVFPEIFVGVHLDEQVTKHSGVFHSRQYFDCPYGYGIMVPYDQVKKMRNENEPITKDDFLRKPKKSQKKVPYSIKRWKSSVDVTIPDIVKEVIIKPNPSKTHKNVKDPRYHRKKKTVYKPAVAVKHVPVPVKKSKLREKPVAKLERKKEYTVLPTPTLISKVDEKTLIDNKASSRFMPDPYPSRSALQQSFAMITDSAYSSADSGYSEYITWREQNNRKIHEFLQGASPSPSTNPKQLWEWPRDQLETKTDTLSSSNTVRHKSLPGDYVTAPQIERHRRIVCSTSTSFDPDDYDHDGYYKRGRKKKEKQRVASYMNNEYISHFPTAPYRGMTSSKSFHLSGEKDSLMRESRNQMKMKRTLSQSLSSSCSESENLSSEENDLVARDLSFRNFEQLSPTSTGSRKHLQGRMARAQSCSDATTPQTSGVSKKELKQWRKKFGEVEASHMVNGLQKLQDAFAKGMNLTDTYGYPTSQGRYVRVGK